MTNRKHFLLTTPNHDDTVGYLAESCKQVIEFAKSKSFDIANLNSKKATKKELEKRLKKHDSKFVMLNGHGDIDSVTGYNNEVLIKCGEKINLMKNRIVYALSCFSLSKLGKECVKKGTIAYAGYTFPFMFYFDPSRSATPAKDKIAQSFFVAANMVPVSLLKGQSISEAVKRSRREYDNQIEKWKVSSSPDSEWVVSALLNDKTALDFEGKADAKI